MGSFTQLAIVLTVLHITRRRVVINLMCELPFMLACYVTARQRVLQLKVVLARWWVVRSCEGVLCTRRCVRATANFK